MDREYKIEDALNTLCYALDEGRIGGLDDGYNCKGINCRMCLFSCLDAFKEFLKKYRYDKGYGNGE